MKTNISRFLRLGNGLATASRDQLINELTARDRSDNLFPLDVFPGDLKPYIESLALKYDIPRAYIGLAMLTCYSSAIGTSYVVSTNRRDKIYLPIWGCLVGMSSSGGSLALNQILNPLQDIQSEFDDEWDSLTAGMTPDKINQQKLRTIVYRDAHIPTLVRNIMPDNPKGVLKFSDELLEWINGMNQLSKKEGTDEQFWISSWNCTKYSGIRAGKQKFVIPRPFVNVIGKSQWSLLPKLFAKDRDTTGFIFRLLFAVPDIDRFAVPDPFYQMPEELYQVHDKLVKRLYNDLQIEKATDDPNKCLIEPSATKLYHDWVTKIVKEINQVDELTLRDIHGGIFGKIKEYALRFAAILHLIDRANDPRYGSDFYTNYKVEEFIGVETMQRALSLANYFYASAKEVYEKVQKNLTAPTEVLIAANMLKRGATKADICEALFNTKEKSKQVKTSRLLAQWIKAYPKVFGSIAK